MKKLEILLFVILFLGGFVAIFLPDTKPFEHVINAKQLIYELSKQGRYVSVDEVAQAVMESDPSYLLIDVRTPEEYAKYSIDGAINIPADKVMDKDNEAYFNQDVYTTVLFSNGSSLADQTWLRLRSYDFKGNKVMKGGLNAWYTNILNPRKPDEIKLTNAEKERYLFRKGASVFFTGAQVVGDAPPKTKSKSAGKPVVRRKKKAVSGGCG